MSLLQRQVLVGASAALPSPWYGTLPAQSAAQHCSSGISRTHARRIAFDGRACPAPAKASRGAPHVQQTACTYTGTSTDDAIRHMALELPLPALMQKAAQLRDTRHQAISFSPKVFLPLTRLCRDSCGYCTFATPPAAGRRAYMTLEEVVSVARAGAAQGCTEALFTLGEKPEDLYPDAAAELQLLGHSSTVSYVAEAAATVFRETGLLPHVNAGTLTTEELLMLRSTSASQGLMLESTSTRLMEPGMPHHQCPDKDPTARLATIAAAGAACIPFTTGILIGIGETRAERLDALFVIRDLHAQYGHIQEVIIQNFRAKKGTAMAEAQEPPLEELLWTVAMARIILGPSANIQAPPNLTPIEGGAPGGVTSAVEDSWHALLAAGINDWGGLSPLTRDFVNPEKPWPSISALAAVTAQAGFALLPRLTAYPEYMADSARWLDSSGGFSSIAAGALRLADTAGLVRGSVWCPGSSITERFLGVTTLAAAPEVDLMADEEARVAAAASHPLHPTAAVSATSTAGSNGSGSNIAGLDDGIDIGHQGGVSSASRSHAATPLPRLQRRRAWQVAIGENGLMRGCAGPAPSPVVRNILARVLDNGQPLDVTEITRLFSARGADFQAVCRAADELRKRTCGDDVSYTVNRNINYTNVCTFACQFCAFSKGKASEDLRGKPYLLSLEEVSRRVAEAWQRGAGEVCMQGGIHPEFNGETYLRLLGAAREAAPRIHVHAFSPLEVAQGAQSSGWSIETFLQKLKAAGLWSLPGTAAEVLDADVRRVLCPDKLSVEAWLHVVETAHKVGIKTSSTIMFGHCDSYASWARHLLHLRALQAETGGITEFVPLPFVHMQAPIYLKGRARRGPTLTECILMHAVARLALHPLIPNIQASWVKMGPERAAMLLGCGCNDMGGSLMSESITKAAGADYGQELSPERMVSLIESAGKQAWQRTTLYQKADPEQSARAFAAAPLQPQLMS